MKHSSPENHPASTDRAALELSSWFSVVRAYEVCVQQYARMLDNFGITTPQFDALSAIQYLGSEALPKRIAERLVVSRPNVTGLLRRLEERGLIETVPHATDGRSSICRLTGRGQDCTAAVQAAATRFIREQAAPFEDAELIALETFMRAMRRHLLTLDPDALAAGATALHLRTSKTSVA